MRPKTSAKSLSISHGEQGLTLVELLFVSVLLALMATLLFGTLTGLTRSKAAIERERQYTRSAQIIFTRIGRELLNLSLDQPLRAPVAKPGQNRRPSGPSSSQLAVRGGQATINQLESSVIRFVSANSAQAFAGAQGNTGLVEIEYRLEEAPEEDIPGVQSTTTERGIVLVREESPAGVFPQTVLKTRIVTLPLIHEVTGFELRYLIRGKWQKSFPGRGGGQAPQAVEMTLRMKFPQGVEEVYRTAFPIVAKKQTGTATDDGSTDDQSGDLTADQAGQQSQTDQFDPTEDEEF